MKTHYEVPPQCARLEGAFDSYVERGFTLARLRTCRATPGCNGFVLRKTEEIQ